MPRTFKIKGIVIKRVDFGEADKLVTVFSRKHGKVVVLAKGVRRINSRKAPHLELFSFLKANICSGKTWDYVVEAETIESFPFLRSKIARVAYGFKIAEITDRLCVEKQEQKNIFKLLLNILKSMNYKTDRSLSQMVDNYNSQLLWELGFLQRGRYLSGTRLEKYLENIMERKLKSKSLLEKL